LGLLCSLGVQTLPKTRFGLFDDLSFLKYLKNHRNYSKDPISLFDISFLPWRFTFLTLVCKLDPEFVALGCHGTPGLFLRQHVPARPGAIRSARRLWLSRSGSEDGLRRRRRLRIGVDWVGQKPARLGAPGALRPAGRSGRWPLLLLLQGQLGGASFGGGRLLLLSWNYWLLGRTALDHSLLLGLLTMRSEKLNTFYCNLYF
jgi:hypothetical protein